MVVTYAVFLGFFAAMLWAFCLAELWRFAMACRYRRSVLTTEPHVLEGVHHGRSGDDPER